MNEGMRMTASVLFSLFSVWIMKLYLDTFLTKRSGYRKAAGWLLFFLWQMYGRLYLAGDSPIYYLFGSFAVIGLVGIVGYTSAIWNQVTFSALFAALWELMDMFFLLGTRLFLGGEADGTVTAMWLSKLCLFSLILGIRRYMKAKGSIGNLPAQGLSFLLPFTALMTVYFAFYMIAEHSVFQGGNMLFWLLLGTSGMILLNLLVYPAYLLRVEEARIKKNECMYIKQLELFKKQKQLEAQETIELQTKRHDMKQKLIYIHELAQKEEMDRLMAVLDEMIGETSKKEHLDEWTGNLVVDSLVNHLYRVAQAKKIKLDTRIKVPKELNIEDTDLCILLGNAFDNAVEALEYVEEEKRDMRVDMKYERGCLLLCVRNKFADELKMDEEGRLKTRKTEGVHGLGIRSMKKVTERYHGVLITEGEDDLFTLKAILYEPKKA